MDYDYTFLCTYKIIPEIDDEDRMLMYQIQLLDALKITNINNLDKKINELYEYCENIPEIINHIESVQNYDYNKVAIFKIFFSYEYFDSFHKCLVNYFEKKII